MSADIPKIPLDILKTLSNLASKGTLTREALEAAAARLNAPLGQFLQGLRAAQGSALRLEASLAQQAFAAAGRIGGMQAIMDAAAGSTAMTVAQTGGAVAPTGTTASGVLVRVLNGIGRVVTFGKATGGAATVAGAAASTAVVVGLVWVLSNLAGRLSADKPVQPGPAMSQSRPTTSSGATAGGGTPTSVPGKDGIWVRKGPFFASNDTENRKPQRLDVGDTSLSFTQEVEGKTYKNTLTWTPPPETLKPGQEVKLTLSATSEQRGASVGGWWNINCQSDLKGDKSAGSPKNYRLSGSPDPHSATCTFTFTPSSNPYVQLSAGNNPAPELWVLVTYRYERKDNK